MQFKDLGLINELQRALEDTGYTQPTPIQEKAIPLILSGCDVLAGAQTGTGKTAGFTLPLLQLLNKSLKTNREHKQNRTHRVRALILTPTRELAAQVGKNVEEYGKYLPFKSKVIFGGVNINPQITHLKNGVDIVIATPGRLLDHVNRKTINLSQIEILVLDEADRMLDMGFIHDIKKILKLLPQRKQNLLFSATFSAEIKRLASSFLITPKLIETAQHNKPAELVSQTIYPVDNKNKRKLLSFLISSENWRQVLVFTRTKHGANKLSNGLIEDGITAAAIHGNKSQGARTKALDDFKKGKIRVLVATDIAARGLDIEELPYVVNYELPNVSEDYIHRIGRTGRAGAKGKAVSLVCSNEHKLLADIERLMKKTVSRVIVPGYEEDPSIKMDPIDFGRNQRRHHSQKRTHNHQQQRGQNQSSKKSKNRKWPRK